MSHPIKTQIVKLEEERKKAIEENVRQQQRHGEIFSFLYKNDIEREIESLRKKVEETYRQQSILQKAYFQPLDDYLKKNTAFCWQEDGNYRLYKFLTNEWKSPYQGFQYKLGEKYNADVEHDENISCGQGLSVGTLEWVVNTIHAGGEHNIQNRILVVCLVPKVSLLEYCIPLHDRGKIRISTLKIKESIPWSKLVHDCADCSNKFISEDPHKVNFKTFQLKFCNDACRKTYKKTQGYVSCNECKKWNKPEKMYTSEFCSQGCEHDSLYTTCNLCHDEFEKGEGIQGDTYCSMTCYSNDDYYDDD